MTQTAETGQGLLILAPLWWEARAAAPAHPANSVVRTGAGLRKARATAGRLLAGPKPAAVAVAGVAGALIPGIAVGTVVVADRVLDATGRTIKVLDSAPLIEAALRRRGVETVVGPIVSVARLVQDAEARAGLAETGAIAVDMETAALLDGPWGVPTAVVRSISDTPESGILSPAIVPNGLKALNALKSCVPALEEWAAAVGPRKVILAGPRSFCAGVERAIHTVERAIERFGTPVYVRKQIVHNRHVVEDLEQQGAVFVEEVDEVPEGATLVFSAHGVSPRVRSDAEARDLRVIDATCPLVAKVHHEVRRFAERGYQIVLIGHPGHDETEGTLGESDRISLIETIDDVDSLEVDDPDKLAYITQTTLSPDDVSEMVGALAARFPNVVGPHSADICYATQNRQDAVRAIAGMCDLLLVVGSSNSSNTARLVEVSERAGCRAVMIDDQSEIRAEWLTGATVIGVTAGASAPPSLVERVVESLRGLGPIDIEEHSVRTENVNFPLPLEVR